MFQMVVLAQRHMETPHAKGEMLGDVVNGACSNWGTINESFTFRIH